MDFMNLNQAAHGDREHGFITARLRLTRKVVVGYWQDTAVTDEISAWMRSAAGFVAGEKLKVVRFADNMREVAVTEGDKVEAQIKFGWAINSVSMGTLASAVDEVSEKEAEALLAEMKRRYDIVTDNMEAVNYQAKIEIAMRPHLRRARLRCNSNLLRGSLRTEATARPSVPAIDGERLRLWS